MSEEEVAKFLAGFSRRISEIDRLATAVLKAHFLVEEFLDRALAAAAKSPKHLELERNPRFAQKMKWLRAFAPLGDDSRWELVSALNNLRNKVAHKVDGPERKEALQKLRKELAPHVKKELSVLNEQRWPDYNIVLAAAMESNLFLTQVRTEVGK